MKTYKYLILGIIEIFLLIIIVFLGIKINKLSKDKIKGIYVTKINSESIVFSSKSGNLKYFYEPISNRKIIDKPDWLDHESEYTINNDSLNERFNYSISKSPDIYRIITIGDSFTFGLYVNTSDNYPETLENLMNRELKCKNIKKFEVINLGVGNYNIGFTVERFLKRGLKYKPDLVIWLINPHNLSRPDEIYSTVSKQINSKGIPYFDPVSQKHLVAEETMRIINNEYTNEFISNYILKAFSRFNKYFQGKLIVVTMKNVPIPNLNVLNDFISQNKNYVYYPSLFNTLLSNNYSLADSHPNKDGYKKIAEDIIRYLISTVGLIANKCW